MKKLHILSAMMLSTVTEMAQEVKINGGWDFDRAYKNDLTKHQKGLSNTNYDYKFKNGPVAGIEWLFDNQGRLELGIGAEHKFSVKSSALKDKNEMRMYEITPMYLTGKYNLITSKAGNDLLYLIGRGGYAYAKAGKDNKEDLKDKNFRGGLYYAGGLGTQVGPISVEALYERSNLRYDKVNLGNINRNNISTLNNFKKTKDNINTVGVRIGYSIGNIKNLPKKKNDVVPFDPFRTDIFAKTGDMQYTTDKIMKRKWNGGELRLNAGYNFKDRYNVHPKQFLGTGMKNNKWQSAKSDFDVKGMPVVGLEYLFDNQGAVELGLGVEQRFLDISPFFNDKEQKHVLRTYPAYATTKINLVNNKGNNLLYAVGRVGYVYGEIKEENFNKKDLHGGLYYAGGLGTELGPISLEALYERANFKYQPKDTINPIKVKSKIDTFGIRLGYRLGSIKNKPKIKEVKTAAYTYNSVPEEDRINIADNLKGKNDSILTSRSSAAKNKKHFEDEIIKEDKATTYSYDIPEEDRIDIISNLKGNNNVKNVKYSEDKIKGESNKTISEKDAIDMISNLTPNRL
ncbi:hypothetical protein BCB68_00120 [Leptotrichia sp. oral taxon 498]|uniref:hypothetical protein n=1 Tax=Leptotrichia sp. oral taxon 498 TaxID=712368 RepID=UPI000B8CEEB3|nr:hypothetical protein [Leptotrichia sp. oral taxon 498]ASQ47517.1 hypothetical protein BCB68_00120 [Leptotrichia sp. oral taxon 498]